ncbi:MAG: hypothetical protein RIC14_12445 [Filomicrobium sp.]
MTRATTEIKTTALLPHRFGLARPPARTPCFAKGIASILAAGTVAVSGGMAPAAAQTQSCARGDFEAVVDNAAGALRTLNSQHKPDFQQLLRELRLKRGWSHDEFLQQATPFVEDEVIDGYDLKSQNLLAEIATLGEEGTNAANPDCAILEQLRQRMRDLVDAQSAKWQYMFEKLQKEIDK